MLSSSFFTTRALKSSFEVYPSVVHLFHHSWKMLRRALGIESGDEVKELMLGKICSAPIHSVERPSLLTNENYQNLGGQAEISLVSNYHIPDLDL